MTVQIKTKGVDGAPIWVSPLRDTAHIFPQLLRAALIYADQEILNTAGGAVQRERLAETAEVLLEYVKVSTQPAATGTTTAEEIADRVGFTKVDRATEDRVGRWLLRVLLKHYTRGIREALHGVDEVPVGVTELMQSVAELREEVRLPWWRRWIRLRSRTT